MCEIDDLIPSTAKVRNECSYTSIRLYAFMSCTGAILRYGVKLLEG